MRLSRLKGSPEQPAVYHCISRVVGGQYLLDDLGKEKLSQLLLKLAAFCGVEVITYCMMANHFHLLIRVPIRQDLSDAQLLQRLEDFYGKKGVLTALARQDIESRGGIDAVLRQSLLERRGDVSAFLKEFKQNFSRWYHRQAARFGTPGAERFKRVHV